MIIYQVFVPYICLALPEHSTKTKLSFCILALSIMNTNSKLRYYNQWLVSVDPVGSIFKTIVSVCSLVSHYKNNTISWILLVRYVSNFYCTFTYSGRQKSSDILLATVCPGSLPVYTTLMTHCLVQFF